MSSNIKDTVASWKNLNRRTPWLWPAVPRYATMVGLIAVVCAAGYFTLVSPEQDTLAQSEDRMLSLKDEYKVKYQMAANLAAYKKLRAETEVVLDESLRQLPSKSEMESLLNDIHQAALGRGLEFDLFKPNATENMFEFYAELPIAVKIEGTYHDLAEFSSAVARLSRIVTINDVELSIVSTPPSATQSTKAQQISPPVQRMLMTAVIKTYRYLDDTEMKAQQKLAQANKKNTKK